MANALLLGGGAPTLTLQSGALAAFHDRGVRFDCISTAGAGMVIGLLYLAPRGMSPIEALRNTREMGVDDALYDLFPVNFKVFFKPGPLAAAWRAYVQHLPQIPPTGMPGGRFVSDMMALGFAAWSPSALAPWSLGLCEHAPWIEQVVDFEALKAFEGEFYMNAYCLDTQEMEIFEKEDITPEHFKAALAFPFLYPPFRLNGKTYIEGSAIDTLCFEGLLKYRQERRDRDQKIKAGDGTLKPMPRIDNVIIFDVLSSKDIIRPPRNLYDAWVQSIMTPLVEIAKDDVRLFEAKHLQNWQIDLLKIEFDIPRHHWPKVLDWSYSNLSTLYDIGYESGHRFCDEHRERLFPLPEAAD